MKLAHHALALAACLTLSIAGCSSTTCGACGPCPESFIARVTAPGAGSVEIDGVPCAADGGVFVCSVTPGVGARTVLIQAPGFVTATESVITAPPPAGCCTCSAQTTRDVTLRPVGSDAGAGDASVDDAGAPASDAGSDGGMAIDAGASTCDESRVMFRPAGGHLEPGQLCDDVFACAADDADAARIVAAASSFVCDPAPKGPCSGITCVMRPSTLDANEISEICALTQLASPPEISCLIYL
jgi:hypothetical protein